MQSMQLRSFLPSACPACETELDAATGVCPACLWDGSNAVQAPVGEAAQEPVSYSERYGGPRYPTASQVAQRSEPTMARGRLFLIVGTVVTLLLIVVVSGSVQAF